MNELLVSLLMFFTVITFVIIFLYKGKEFSSLHYIIYFILLMSWTAMFIFKINPNISTKGFIGKTWWSWPIIISLYQFTQVFARILISKLSKKIVSRKIPIMIVMSILFFGLVLVISSNFADWAIIIAIICSGVTGAIYGLDAQYWSENWNIKKGFLSSLIIFTIPFLSRQIAKIFNLSFTKINDSLFWVTFLAIVILTVAFIIYSLFVKEDKKTIFIDNMNPKAKPFKNKTMYDVFVISFVTGLITGSFTFVNYLGITLGKLSEVQKLIFPFIQILFTILTPMLLLRFIKIWNLHIVANILLFISSLVLSLLLITNSLNIILLILLISLMNAAFGIYILLTFGSVLHFDHKFPAFVMTIFLTVKSFFTGLAEVSSQIFINENLNISTSKLGWISFSLVVSLSAGALVIANSIYLTNMKKHHIIKSLLQHSYHYETSW